MAVTEDSCTWSTWAGLPEVFFKSSLLTCLPKETQTCLTGWRSSRPFPLPTASQEQRDTIPTIANANFYRQSKLLLRNWTKTSSLWLQPRPYFPFLSNIPFTQMWKSGHVGGGNNLSAPLRRLTHRTLFLLWLVNS